MGCLYLFLPFITSRRWLTVLVHCGRWTSSSVSWLLSCLELCFGFISAPTACRQPRVMWSRLRSASSWQRSALAGNPASTLDLQSSLSAFIILPSVLWRCWLGGRKSIRPVKTKRWGAGVVICLEQGADLHMAQLMPLPLTVSCFSKIQIVFTFLVLAQSGSLG